MKERIRRYGSLTDDFYSRQGQEYGLSDSYKWIRTDFVSRVMSAFIYAAAILFSSIYCRLFLHMHIKGAGKLRKNRGKGFFLYGNHTQPVGDVFIPAHACFPKRIYTIVSVANMGLPFIGKLLPYLGALPIPQTLKKMKEFNRAVERRIDQGKCVVIYPEAHVWDYCTFIRPFADTSFKYPVKFGAPVYSMTTTYQKRKAGKKPRITVYIDGPFTPDNSENAKASAAELCNKVCECMTERSKLSNFEYVKYVSSGQ